MRSPIRNVTRIDLAALALLLGAAGSAQRVGPRRLAGVVAALVGLPLAAAVLDECPARAATVAACSSTASIFGVDNDGGLFEYTYNDIGGESPSGGGRTKINTG